MPRPGASAARRARRSNAAGRQSSAKLLARPVGRTNPVRTNPAASSRHPSGNPSRQSQPAIPAGLRRRCSVVAFGYASCDQSAREAATPLPAPTGSVAQHQARLSLSRAPDRGAALAASLSDLLRARAVHAMRSAAALRNNHKGRSMAAITERRVREGLPHPRGATWDGEGVNFALFSAHATRVELCLFDDAGERETARIDLPEYHRRDLARLSAGCAPGHRSTAIASTAPMSRCRAIASIPNKLLLDPYARGHFGDLKWDPAVFGYQMESGDDTTFDERDSAPFMPKCVVVDPEFRLERRAAPGAPCRGITRSSTRLHRARLHQASSRSAEGMARHL